MRYMPRPWWIPVSTWRARPRVSLPSGMRWPISCACWAGRSRATWPIGIREMSDDDDGVLPLPSLMEAWRPPTGGKRSLRGATLRIRSGGKGRGNAAPALSAAEARAKLERIVRKAPEVMVKISGKQRGARHLAEHFGYISRHGKLEIRSSEGEIITDEKRLKAIAADWDMLDQAMNAYGKDRPTSMSMVLSMPGGTTDAATIHDAVQAFARVEFEGQFSYMVALHTDTAHRSEEHTSELQSLM